MKFTIYLAAVTGCLLLMSCSEGGNPTNMSDPDTEVGPVVEGNNADRINSAENTAANDVQGEQYRDDEEADPQSMGYEEITEFGLSVVRMPNGDRFFEGDILIPEIAPQPGCPNNTGNNGDTVEMCFVAIDGISGGLWPGRMPIKISDDFDPVLEEKLFDAISLIEKHSALDITMWSNDTMDRNHVRIVKGNGNFSRGIGMQGGAQLLSLRVDAPIGTVVHELMHAAGFYHEQSRDDRESPIGYIKVADANVVKGKGHNFKVAKNTVVGQTYDYNSVLHYPQYAWSVCADGSDPDGPCSEDTKLLDCPDGSKPGPMSMWYRCATIVPLQQIPNAEITCIAGKYTCTNYGSRYDNSMGQRIGLSPGDIAGLQALYGEPRPVTTLSLNITYLSNPQNRTSPAILLDDESIIDTVQNSWYDFAWGPIGVTPGTHQLSVVKTREDDRNEYEIDYSGDCDTEGNFVSNHSSHRDCTIEIRLIPEHTLSSISPEGLTEGSFEFIWNSAANAFNREYEIRIATNGTYPNWETFYSSDVCDELVTKVCSVPASAFDLDSGNHAWQVRVKVSGGWGPWSDLKYFELHN